MPFHTPPTFEDSLLPKRYCFCVLDVEVKQTVSHGTTVHFQTIILENLARIGQLKVLHLDCPEREVEQHDVCRVSSSN